MRKSSSLLAALLVAAVILAVAGSCGKSSPKHESAFTPLPESELSLTGALGELNALAPPAGVDPAIFQQLKDELTRQLTARAGGKQTLRPPDGLSNAVEDLALIPVGDGTFSLQWTYRNVGDYDQNGQVGISDITPLAMYYQSTGITDPNTAQGLVDGNGDQRLDISDVTPIAMHFGSICGSYLVQYALDSEGPWDNGEIVSTPSGAPDPVRYLYTLPLPPGRSGFARVVPVDDNVLRGQPSNVVALPAVAARPSITAVSPTTLRAGFAATFSAVVTGDAPLTYLWDFGGGATPNTSSEVSPTATMGVAGAYDASLTVSNASGVSTFPFILTLTDGFQPPSLIRLTPDHGFVGLPITFNPEVTGTEPMAFHWNFGDTAIPSTADTRNPTVVFQVAGLHTITCSVVNEVGNHELGIDFNVATLTPAQSWGGEWYEDISGIAVDGAGNVYAVGSTSSFGAGGDDVLLLKYDSDGNLIYNRTWGSAGSESAADIALGPDGSIYIAGESEKDMSSDTNVLLLKFTADGDFVYSRTWGGDRSESATGIAVDAGGNVYISGTELWGNGWFSINSNALFLKYDSGGSFQFGRVWHGVEYELSEGRDITVIPSGDVFITGGSGPNAVLLKYDSNGTLLSNRHSVWSGGGRGICITADNSGNVYVAGDSNSQVILMKYDIGGNELYRRAWGGSGWDRSFGITLDDTGALYVCGSTDGFGAGWVDALEIKYDPANGDVLAAYTWGTAEVEEAFCIAARPGGGVVLGGDAPNATGTWECAIADNYSYTINTVLPTEQGTADRTSTAPSVVGTTGTPTGVIFTGGGRNDALIVFD